MRKLTLASLALTTQLLLVGCAGDVPLTASAVGEDGAPVRTDAAEYIAERGAFTNPAGEEVWYYRLSIGVTFVNRTGRTVLVHGCGGGVTSPGIDKRIEGAWVAAYRGPMLRCAGGWPVEPGGVFRHEFQIRAHDPEFPHGAAWLPETVEGEYRLHLWVFDAETHERVPLDDRVSDTFRIVEAR